MDLRACPLNAPQEMHPVFLSHEQLERQCRVSFKRASGPGGQNRNKVETAVEVHHVSSGISGSASERRTQKDNRRVAVDRLRIKLAIELRTSPSEEGRHVFAKYTRQGRISVSETNWDWPTILCEILNRLESNDWEVMELAVQLDVSSSQLLKLLKQSPEAWLVVNRARAALGKHPFK